MKIIELWSFLSDSRKRHFWLLAILMFLASMMEVVSIGLVLPFLAILTEPEMAYKQPYIQPIAQFFGLNQGEQLLLPITIFFISTVLFSGIVRLTYLYAMTKFSYMLGVDFRMDIFRSTLYQDYAAHLKLNSSEAINNIINKAGIIASVVISYITMLNSIVLITLVLSALILINTIAVLAVFFSFGLLYWLLILYTKQKLISNSRRISIKSTQLIKSLQEALGGIRDVIIDNSQEFYCKFFHEADISLRRANGINSFIAQSPKFIMEAIGIILIAIVAFIMNQQKDEYVSVIPILGAFALGAQRLLPAFQQIYLSLSELRGSQASINDIVNILKTPLPASALNFPLMPIRFEKEIRLTNLCYRYEEHMPWVLESINLSIKKGSRTGFIGITGSGKSTLLDILMGLLVQSKGKMSIDGVYINEKNISLWRKNISHVPQDVYLSDATIEENIAFGISQDKIDHQRVLEVSEQACISKLISGWKDQYKTIVGERGVKISGGQKQRIGIARALYRNADVLVFDEATSALDSQTEKTVMELIEKLSREITILIIAHRVTSLKGCDQIIEIHKNNAIQIGSYEEMIKSNKKVDIE